MTMINALKWLTNSLQIHCNMIFFYLLDGSAFQFQIAHLSMSMQEYISRIE